MKTHEAEKLIATICGFIEEPHVAGPPPRPGLPSATSAPVAVASGAPSAILTTEQLEKLYLMFKRRFLDELPQDPVLLQLVARRPEIILELEPRVVPLDGSSLKGRLALLISRGFMGEARATSAIRRELARTGADPGGGGSLSEKLAELVREGFLTREGEGWEQAPGIKITEKVLERV